MSRTLRVSKEFMDSVEEIRRKVKHEMNIDISRSDATKIVASRLKGIQVIGVKKKRPNLIIK